MIRAEIYSNGVCVSAEVVDLEAGTFTLEEHAHAVSTRPLTADEVARYTPPAPVATAEEKLAQARTALDQITSLLAPVLTADVVDLLDDLRTVL